MDGGIVTVDASEGVIALEPRGRGFSRGDIWVYAQNSFTPSFQLITHREWISSEYYARDHVEGLSDDQVRAVLKQAGRESLPHSNLADGRPHALRDRLEDRLRCNGIKAYRFEGSERDRIAQIGSTVLVDIRKAGRPHGWDSPYTSPKELREAIAQELSFLLAAQGATKDAWENVYQQERFYLQILIDTGAVIAGGWDAIQGLKDSAVAIVDVMRDATSVKLQIEIAVLTGNIAYLEKLVRDLGGQLQNGADGAKRLMEEGAQVLRVLLAEPAIGPMLKDYFLAYYSATPHTEQVRTICKITGDILIALAIAIGTAGLGTGASAANLTRNFGMLNGRVIQMLGRVFRGLKKAASKAPDEAPRPRPVPHEKAPDPKADAPKVPPGMARVEPPCFQPGSAIPANKYPEYDRQLKGQEGGLNDMTVDEYIQGRNRYGKFKREGQYAQQKSRDKYQDELTREIEEKLVNEGVLGEEATASAIAAAKKQMATLDALHNPDQVVGGKLEVSDFGDKNVNRSIGRLWQSRVAALDKAAQSIPSELRKNMKMNVKLERCK